MLKNSFAVSLLGWLLLSAVGLCAPHAIKDDPFDFPNGFDLSDYAGKSTMLGLMKDEIQPQIEKVAEAHEEGSAKAGPENNKNGVAVKINDQNFFYHVGYPASDTGGRSYGWRKGQDIGDWTDKQYLDAITKLFTLSDTEMHGFYLSLIQLIGACDAKSYSQMKHPYTQLVATNFLAIYGAEQYRAQEGTPNWDDAIFQVTLLAAFHAGQDTFTKFYRGKFSNFAYNQKDCVYRAKTAGDNKKDAEMNDYWQYGANCPKRSGIHITRRDYEAMGAAISKFYEKKHTENSANYSELKEQLGEGDANIIKAVSEYFILNEGDDLDEVDPIANTVADFLVGLRKDADAITKFTAATPKTRKKTKS